MDATTTATTDGAPTLKPWVRIHGERGRQYLQRLGTNLFPILSAVPVLGELPGIGVHPCYVIDPARLDPRVRDGIARWMAEKFGLGVDEVVADIDRGMSPVRVLPDVELVMDDPTAWG